MKLEKHAQQPHVLWPDFYQMPKIGKSTQRKMSGCLGVGGRKKEWLLMHTGFLSGIMKNVLKVDSGDVYITLLYTNTILRI